MDDLLMEIMQVQFIAIDLNLYLDMHPKDQQAAEIYSIASRLLGALTNEYERKYGPLFNFGFSKQPNPQQWIKEPWPWESRKDCEV